MKLNNPCVTILISEDGATIEVRDRESSTTFVKVKLNPIQLAQALGRLSNTDCEAEVFGLDKIGKKMEMSSLEFEVPANIRSIRDTDENILRDLAVKELENLNLSEWKPDLYFGSKDSFFTKDERHFARTAIRRWV